MTIFYLTCNSSAGGNRAKLPRPIPAQHPLLTSETYLIDYQHIIVSLLKGNLLPP